MTNLYTIDEVGRHNNDKDLWIVIHNMIYDVTSFLQQHPGGDEVLLKLAGKDATECFESIGHSHEAINLREDFKIGELIDANNADTLKTDRQKTYQQKVDQQKVDRQRTDLLQEIKTKENQTKAEIKQLLKNDDWPYEEQQNETSKWFWLFVISTGIIINAIIIYYLRNSVL
ncbi:hypothetical protein P5V15_013711 [Pogonomyrmex californicus]